MQAALCFQQPRDRPCDRKRCGKRRYASPDGTKYESRAVILATGHSCQGHIPPALLQRHTQQPKGIAVGVRIEHPQELIDRIQYGPGGRGEYLPAASYKLVEQCGGRGVYSFCMCPGGYIVPSATEQQQVVVNGMSPSSRDNKYANSGIVVAVNPRIYPIHPLRDNGCAGFRIRYGKTRLGGRRMPARALRRHV